MYECLSYLVRKKTRHNDVLLFGTRSETTLGIPGDGKSLITTAEKLTGSS